MTFTWDFNTATLVAILAQTVFIVSYIIKTNGLAKQALSMAEKAHERAEDAHDKIGVLNAALSLHRETVAREYHDKHELRQMETRIEGALKQMEKRLTGQISELRGHPHPPTNQ